ncbi:MAG: hypothetical protein RJA44_2419 [Pseudomonadota bacterium]|jgi:hypothetical protein
MSLSTTYNPIRNALRLAAAVALGAAATAQAADINSLNTLSQSDFRKVSEDLGAAVSYRSMAPAESLGILGFDLGLSLNGTTLKSLDALRQAAGGSSMPATLPLVSVRAQKGLPFDIDVGAALGAIPATNVRTFGGEVKWAVLPGSTLLPAVALRGSISSLNGVDQLSLNTRSVDLSVSKGLLMLTPYIGVGQVWVKSEANGVSSLQTESFSKSKVFAGVNFNLGFNLAFEADKIGDVSSYGLKMGVRF